MWTVLKAIVLTAAAWGAAAALFALVLWAAIGPFAQTSHITYGQVYGGIISAIITVAVVRFAVVAPLLTVDIVRDSYGVHARRRLEWSMIIWPARY